MKKSELKTSDTLTPAILQKAPVWEFVNDDALGELAMRPVSKLPVKNLKGRLVGTELFLANGRRVWGLLGNVQVDNQRFNEHFMTVSVERDGQWFMMARYHDYDAAERGPKALADFLGMAADDVFPISYDISGISLGEMGSLIGRVEMEPRERLTRAQVIALAVP